MAGFSGRRNLFANTTVDSLNGMAEYDLAMQPQADFGFGIDNELEMFATTQFTDFDLGEQSPVYAEGAWPNTIQKAGAIAAVNPAFEFANADFQVSNYHGYPNSGAPERPVDIANNVNAAPSFPLSKDTSPSLSNAGSSRAGEKRKADTPASSADSAHTAEVMEEASRMAAEEDKRRRNTAASARFRVKKKQREQALEKSAKEMTDRVTFLETRVSQLEMENKLLKDLITEKSGKEVDMTEINKKVKEATPGVTSPRTKHRPVVKAERAEVALTAET